MTVTAQPAEARASKVTRAFAWVVVRLGVLIVPAWIAAAVLATIALPSLGHGGALGGIEPAGTQAIRVEQRSAQLFGTPLVSRALVVQHDPRGLTRATQQAAVQRAGRVHDPALKGLRGVVPIVNRTTIVSYLVFGPDSSLDTQDATSHAYAARIGAQPGAAVIGVTGTSPGRVAEWREITDALPWVTIATVFLIALVVGVRFRALGAPLVALAGAVIAYLIAVRVVAWLGERTGNPAPQEVEPVIVVLVLGVVTDYAIFFLDSTRRRLARGDGRRAAAQAGATENIPIVFTAGILVAACTGALVLGRSDFFRAFGPGLAVTAIVAMVVALTFIPAVLALLGPAAFWPRGPSEREAAALDTRSRRFRIARAATARPLTLVIALVCIGALVVAAAGLLRLHLSFTVTGDLPARADAARAADAAAQGFAPGVVAPTEVLVQGPGVGRRVAAIARLRVLLAQRRDVAAVLGPGSAPQTLPPGVAVARNGNAVRYAVVLGVDPLGAAGIRATKSLRSHLPALLRRAGLPGASAGLAGDSALGAETIDETLGDLARVAAAALLATFIVLAVFLRSFTAPLVLLLASVLALAASLGLTARLFEGHFGFDGLAWYVPLTAGVLLVALGSDYNVFVAGRVRQAARTRPLRDAIALAAPRSAKAIVVAGITLALSFGALALVPLRSFRELAFALACGVLLETFFVRALLVPALLALVRPSLGGDAATADAPARGPGLEPGEDEREHAEQPGGDAVLDVMVARPGLVAGEERGQARGGLEHVDRGEGEQRDADDHGREDERGALGHGSNS